MPKFAARKSATAALIAGLMAAGSLLATPTALGQSATGSLGSSSGTPAPPSGGDNGTPGPVLPEPEQPEPESELERTMRTIIAVKKLQGHYGYSALRQQRRIEVQETAEAAQRYAEENLAYFTEISDPKSQVAPYEWPFVGLLEQNFVAEVDAAPGSEGYVGLPPAVDADGNRFSGSRVYRYYYAGSADLLYEAFTWSWNLQGRIDGSGYVNDAGTYVRKGTAEYDRNVPKINVDNPPTAITRDEQLAAPMFFQSAGYGAVHDSKYVYIVEFGESADYL